MSLTPGDAIRCVGHVDPRHPCRGAEGRLGRIYEAIRTSEGHIDNVLQIHSLRPRTFEGHLALYKAVLNNPDIACRRG